MLHRKRTKAGLAVLTSIALFSLILAGTSRGESSFEGKDLKRAEYVQDEIIVKFRKDDKPFRVIKVPRGQVLEKVKEYKKRNDVVYAEPNYIVHVDLIPNDPDFSKLWGLHNTGQTGGTADADIDGPEAWDIQTGSNDVLIAVIDTGVDYNHVDLANNMWVNPGEIPDNGVDDDVNGFIDDVRGWDFYNNDNDPFDDHGHGTHVSGTIGAVGNSGVGVVGVNWNVKIIPIKFLSSGGSGTTAGATDAIRYATKMGVYVTSNSWGGGGYSQALKDAIVEANYAGILFVAAAGNSNSDNDATPHYPSSYDVPNVVAVAATDHNDQRASFSNYGATSVDLGAPGVDVFSTVPTGSCSLCDPSGYKYLSGTSMATPHVSGVVGLIKAQFPALTSDDIKSRLLGTVDPIPSLVGITVTGGRVNAYNSLEVDNVPPSEVTDLASGDPTFYSVILTWTATGDDSSVGTASFYDVRYSTSPINDTNWETTTKATGEPKPQLSGSAETFEITGLSYGTTYYFALKVIDNVGNSSGLSNVVSAKTTTPTTIFKDDMESGVNGWISESLWHQETYRSSSPTTSWAYNTGAPKYNYDVGDNWGSLTSPVIDLSGYSSAILTFQYLYETETTGTTWDKRWVQIGVDGVFTNIAQLSGDSMLVWNGGSLDLSSYAGKPNVQIRFFFDTIDGVLNNYEGLYIDDVVILGEPLGPQPPVAGAGPDQTVFVGEVVTFDGSGSYDPDGEIVSYEWNFGDGSYGSGVNPTHTYTAVGTYEVTLTVTDNSGAVDSDTMTVIVQAKPVMEVAITKHDVRTRWDGRKNIGKVEVGVSFTVNNGSSGQVLLKEITDELGTWSLEKPEVMVRINNVRYIWALTLDANGDAVIDFGAHGITLSAGDVVQISKMQLLNNKSGNHSLKSQILANDIELATNTVNFSL